MHKEVIDIVYPDIRTVDLHSCDLLIQSGEDFSGFALYNQNTKQVYAWVFYDELTASSAEMYSIIQDHSWLTHNYRKVAIINYAPVNILVPAAYNRDSEKELLFDLMGDHTGGRLLSKDLVLQQNIMNHYSISEDAAFMLNQQFPKAYWWHDQSLLLSKTASESTVITVTIWFKSIQLTIEQNGRWLFLQKFAYKTPEDALYHILNCAKQYDLNLKNIPVIVEGFIDQQSKLAETLQQYIPNVEWNNQLAYQYPSSSYPSHILASLDRILTCVS